jgi:Holliday junction resolvase RusA-like endonuclease
MNKGKIAGVRPDAPIYKESNRDSDNLVKAITDALTQLRVNGTAAPLRI